MEKLFLIAEIAATPVAICCDLIESVVTVNEVVNVPRADPVIAGLFSMRSRVLTLVDCQYRITGTQKPFERGCPAVIASINGHSFGLMVDRVRDVVSVSEGAILAATRLDPKWSGLCTSLVEIEDHLVMILDPERLVSIDQRAAA